MKDIKVAKAASTSDDILVRVGAASHDRLDLVHGLGQGIFVILVLIGVYILGSPWHLRPRQQEKPKED